MSPEPCPCTLFISGRSATSDLACDAGLGRLIDALARAEPSLRVATGVGPPGPLTTHKLAMPRSRWSPLPPTPRTTLDGFFSTRATERALARLEAECDVTILQLPFISPFALETTRPRVYHVCSNLVEAARTSTAYRGVRKAGALAVAAMCDDFGEFARSLVAFVPWAALAIARRWAWRTR